MFENNFQFVKYVLLKCHTIIIGDSAYIDSIVNPGSLCNINIYITI